MERPILSKSSIFPFAMEVSVSSAKLDDSPVIHWLQVVPWVSFHLKAIACLACNRQKLISLRSFTVTGRSSAYMCNKHILTSHFLFLICVRVGMWLSRWHWVFFFKVQLLLVLVMRGGEVCTLIVWSGLSKVTSGSEVCPLLSLKGHCGLSSLNGKQSKLKVWCKREFLLLFYIKKKIVLCRLILNTYNTHQFNWLAIHAVVIAMLISLCDSPLMLSINVQFLLLVVCV